MNSYKLGFIGTGIMGESILSGIVSKKAMSPDNLFVYDIDHAKRIQMVDVYGVRACVTAAELVDACDVVFLSIKPMVCQSVLEELADKLAGKAIFSIVAGWSTARIAALAPAARVLCVMPNVAAISGEAMSVLSADHTLTENEFRFANLIFSAFGEVETIPEKHFDIVTGISGSGPAYAFMFIEAMAQAGIYNGLPAKTARKLAAQTLLGAAKTQLLGDRHPADLRDAVCTPGGTTIEAVMELESRGFNGTVMAAVDRCARKYRQMAEKK